MDQLDLIKYLSIIILLIGAILIILVGLEIVHLQGLHTRAPFDNISYVLS